MTAWLRYMYNSPMAEITLTVLTAYATYLVGDQLFGVSGVLAVVILGALPPGRTRPCLLNHLHGSEPDHGVYHVGNAPGRDRLCGRLGPAVCCDPRFAAISARIT